MWTVEFWKKGNWTKVREVETFEKALAEVKALSGIGCCSRGYNLDSQPGEYREIRSFPPKFGTVEGKRVEVRRQTTCWWT